ncbi:hypothetical protein OKW30_008173 [Paraburkholderia sp. Clong3]
MFEPIGCCDGVDFAARTVAGKRVSMVQRKLAEQLVAGAVTPRKKHSGFRTFEQMKLADREVVKAETEVRCQIGIRQLLARQRDVQAHAWRAAFVGAAVGGFHDARTAARDDSEMPRPRLVRRAADQLPQFTGHIVITAALEQPCRDPQRLLIGRCSGMRRQRALCVCQTPTG